MTNELQELTNLSLTNAVTAEFNGTVSSVNVTSDSTVKNSTANGSTAGSSSGNAMGVSAAANVNTQNVQMVSTSTAVKQTSGFTFASTKTEKEGYKNRSLCYQYFRSGTDSSGIKGDRSCYRQHSPD